LLSLSVADAPLSLKSAAKAREPAAGTKASMLTDWLLL
jgi:hypothetical protein